MIPAAVPHDPTDVIGRRIGAYIIDGVLAAAFVALVLVLGNFHLYDRTAPPEGQTATATCDRFNQVDQPAGTPRVVDEQGHSNETTICVPYEGDTIYFDMRDLLGVYLDLFLASLGALVLNLVMLQGLTGATVGKFATGLRTVRADGSHCGIGRAALRTLLLQVIDGQVFIGLILMIVTDGHRRLGDMAAGTYVIDRADVGRPVVIPPKASAVAWTYPPPGSGYPVPGPAPVGAPPMYPAAPPPVTAPTTDGPHWDPDRQAYIRYDRDLQAWLQWSEAHQRWGDIET